MRCPHAAVCSGCSYWDLSPDEQRALKTKAVLAALEASLGPAAVAELPVPEWISPTPLGRGRQRLELQARGRRLGLFAKGETREIAELDVCYQATPALEAWLREVRSLLPALTRAGVRLRVSPSGLRGLWLDLPNEDVKTLLDEGVALEKLLAVADVVEIGQRRKPLVRGPDGRLKLSKEHALRPWTRTWMGEEEVPLLSTVGDFSQPSDECNREIARIISRYVEGSVSVLEFGGGNGNLSFPALTSARRVLMAEREARLADAARLNFAAWANAHPAAAAGKEFRVHEGWLDARFAETEGFDTYLLNPSREGAGKFLEKEIAPSVRKTVMMSCHLDSYARDAASLWAAGFRCAEWTLLDQFPQTPHIEILSTWVRG